MLPREDYVRLSLGANLFFLRIMKEHALFLKASFTPRNLQLAETAGYYMRQFDALLQETVQLSDGSLPQGLLRSGQAYTQYTPDAEKLTQYYTGILVDTSITMREMNLTPAGQNAPAGLEGSVSDLNQRAMSAVTAFTSFKSKVLSDVLACRMFMHMAASMVEHTVREAVYFGSLLLKLQNRVDFRTERDLADRAAFWNPVLADHARFAEGMLDPFERELKERASALALAMDALAAEANQAREDPAQAAAAMAGSLAGAQSARDFAAAGVSGMLSCKVRSVILPLLGDHILRETNYYIYILQEGQISPGS